MKMTVGSIVELKEAIRGDLCNRSQSKVDSRVASNLAECAASALAVRSANSYEWITVFPRICAKKSKERAINRILSSSLVDVAEVMSYYIPEVVKKLSRNGETIVLMLDQSQIRENLQCLMISIRFGERAIPILWKVEETKGNIGFESQKELLDSVVKAMPSEVEILLSADRFYGTKNLVEWCQKAGWHYRIRLKGNLIFEHEGGEITATDVGKMSNTCVIGACFNGSNIRTNIGYLHEKNHPEPWIIAMDCNPSKYRVLDYGMRWGIECMFSDFKSRGFAITDTHLTKVDRLEKLILVLTIALYWAVSIGMTPVNPEEKKYSKKNFTDPCAHLLNKDCEL